MKKLICKKKFADKMMQIINFHIIFRNMQI